MKTFFQILFFLLLITQIDKAQEINENWVPVKFDSQSTIFVNTIGLSSFKANDIYVWIMEDNDPAIEIEMIDKKIYKTKSYLLINKELYRYSILQMIFYDEDNNVIKSYNYERNMSIEDLKYSSPILDNSTIEAVLKKCIEVIENSKAEVN